MLSSSAFKKTGKFEIQRIDSLIKGNDVNAVEVNDMNARRINEKY